MDNINWIAIAIATLTPTVIGFIWYHKAIFGKAWMDSIGMTEEKARSANMPVMFAISIVMAFLLTFFFTLYNNAPGQEGQFDSFRHGASHGIFVAIVVAMPIMVTNALFEQKSWKNTLINLGYWTVTFALIGGVVDSMHHWG